MTNVFPYALTGDPFFTADELAARLQIDPATINSDTADLLAQLASDAVRQDIRLSVDVVEGDEITVYGDSGGVIVLPERPVIAVASVTVGDLSLTTDTFDWRPDGSLFRVAYAGSAFSNRRNWYWPAGVPVAVTYSHGWATVPSPIKSVALELAAGAYNNPELHDSERVGWVEWTTKHIDMNLIASQRSSLDYYRRLDF